ncbi:hypothetical protein ACFQQB_52080 [Nonomuraea rubra]|uniref:hypothetical protein n=1 Tax=Nonomuraea rubra TaxID=46180 RepID=UPI0036164DE5
MAVMEAPLPRRLISTPVAGPLAALVLACLFFGLNSAQFFTGPNFSSSSSRSWWSARWPSGRP